MNPPTEQSAEPGANRPGGRRVVVWVVVGAVVGEVVSLLVLLYAFGSEMVGDSAPSASAVGALGAVGLGPLLGGLAGLCVARGRAVPRWAPAALVGGILVLVGVGLWFGRDTRSEFERNFVAALGGDTTGIGGCVRTGSGFLFCSVYEGGSTVGDPIRVTCREATCAAQWPVRGEWSGETRVEPPVFFTCSRDCREDVARGYVYELVYEPVLEPKKPKLNLGRVETDYEVEELPLDEEEALSPDYWVLAFGGIITPSGRTAVVDGARLSRDPAVHRILSITFSERPPSWEPTYPPPPGWPQPVKRTCESRAYQ